MQALVKICFSSLGMFFPSDYSVSIVQLRSLCSLLIAYTSLMLLRTFLHICLHVQIHLSLISPLHLSHCHKLLSLCCTIVVSRPVNIPQRVQRAMNRPSENHRDPHVCASRMSWSDCFMFLFSRAPSCLWKVNLISKCLCDGCSSFL